MTTSAAKANRNAEIVDRLEGEVARLRSIVRQAIEAHDSGNLQLSSPEIGDPDNDIPMHPWHEEWLHHARAALNIHEGAGE